LAYLSREPLEPGALLETVRRDGDGGLALFIGVVRDHNDGRRVTEMEYEAYGPMAEAEMGRIEADLSLRFPGVRGPPPAPRRAAPGRGGGGRRRRLRPPQGRGLRGLPRRDRGDQGPRSRLEAGVGTGRKRLGGPGSAFPIIGKLLKSQPLSGKRALQGNAPRISSVSPAADLLPGRRETNREVEMFVALRRVHVAASDFPRSRRFYGETLGLPEVGGFESDWVEFGLGPILVKVTRSARARSRPATRSPSCSRRGTSRPA
jgi:Molybdopterin converting factor, large subunit